MLREPTNGHPMSSGSCAWLQSAVPRPTLHSLQQAYVYTTLLHPRRFVVTWQGPRQLAVSCLDFRPRTQARACLLMHRQRRCLVAAPRLQQYLELPLGPERPLVEAVPGPDPRLAAGLHQCHVARQRPARALTAPLRRAPGLVVHLPPKQHLGVSLCFGRRQGLSFLPRQTRRSCHRLQEVRRCHHQLGRHRPPELCHCLDRRTPRLAAPLRLLCSTPVPSIEGRTFSLALLR